MRAIGGYLELEYLDGQEFHSEAIALNTARNCLLFLVEQRCYKTIYFPEYLCPTVVESVAEESEIHLETYSVNDMLLPNVNRSFKHDEVIYIVNYYGLLDNNILSKLKEKYQNIIVDNVQAFFQKPIPQVDTIYSCRKWFGIPDGAYLYAASFPEGASLAFKPMKVNSYIAPRIGRLEEGSEKWYTEFQKVEEALSQEKIAGMSVLSHYILKAINYDAVLVQRNKNFEILNGILGSKNPFSPLHIEGPFSYPFFLEEEMDGIELREKLSQKGIYVPLLWPGLKGKSEKLSKRIIPLPVDQRYTEKDMHYMGNAFLEMLNYT